MPKDDWDKARRRDKARKEIALLNMEEKQFIRKQLRLFPRHEGSFLPDREWVSGEYVFDSSRWVGQ